MENQLLLRKLPPDGVVVPNTTDKEREMIARDYSDGGETGKHYCPSSEEIQRACRVIQAGWSEAERARRMGRGLLATGRTSTRSASCVMDK